MLTIFSTFRPFEGDYNLIQSNALSSWVRMKKAEVLLLGDEAGVAERAKKLGLKHFPEIARNEFGTPLVNKMFELAEMKASNKILCYANADIIMHGLLRPLEIAAKKFDRFLMVARRWDAGKIARLKFKAGWQGRIIQGAKLHAPTGVDVFVFTKGLWPKIPGFALGQWAWDNWLVDEALQLGAPVIDCTLAMTAVHQEHPHYPRHGAQWARNQKLFEGRKGRGTANHANWVVDSQGLRKR